MRSDPVSRPAQAGESALAVHSDHAFLSDASRQTPLSAEEEAALARASQQGDERARAHLVRSHLRNVLRLANHYRRCGVPFNDLVQEGVIGLLRAIERYNPDASARLSTYASSWIGAAMQDHVVRTFSIVRTSTSSAHRSLFFRLRKLSSDVRAGAGQLREAADTAGDEVIGPLARRFGMSLEDVRAMAWRVVSHDASLDAPRGAGGGEAEEEGSSWVESLNDTRPDPENALDERERQHLLARSVASLVDALPDREALIVRRRYLAEAAATLEQIGRELGVSKDRVRQLEKRALDRLKTWAAHQDWLRDLLRSAPA